MLVGLQLQFSILVVSCRFRLPAALSTSASSGQVYHREMNDQFSNASSNLPSRVKASSEPDSSMNGFVERNGHSSEQSAGSSPQLEFSTPPESPKKQPLSQKLSVERNKVFRVLRDLARHNFEFFDQKSTNGWPAPSVYVTRLARCCQELLKIADPNRLEGPRDLWLLLQLGAKHEMI